MCTRSQNAIRLIPNRFRHHPITALKDPSRYCGLVVRASVSEILTAIVVLHVTNHEIPVRKRQRVIRQTLDFTLTTLRNLPGDY